MIAASSKAPIVFVRSLLVILIYLTVKYRLDNRIEEVLIVVYIYSIAYSLFSAIGNDVRVSIKFRVVSVAHCVIVRFGGLAQYVRQCPESVKGFTEVWNVSGGGVEVFQGLLYVVAIGEIRRIFIIVITVIVEIIIIVNILSKIDGPVYNATEV